MQMALKIIATRSSSFFSRSKTSHFPPLSRLFHSSTLISAARIFPNPFPVFSPARRTLCTSPETPPPPPQTKKPNPKLVNFSLPSDSDSDSETTTPKKADKPKLPPPYNPFSNKPYVKEDSQDPKNLQEVFAKMREDGLMNSAVKMFDGLSQDGLTHEALELFSQIKDKGQTPDVVAHTAVMEAYADAGEAKDAHKVYLRMLSSGVLPNAYSYRVLIRSLAESGDSRMAKEAKKYVYEMVGKGMKPNAGTCVKERDDCQSLPKLTRVGLESEGREMLEMLKEKGVVPEENRVREASKDKRGTAYRTLMSALYGK